MKKLVVASILSLLVLGVVVWFLLAGGSGSSLRDPWASGDPLGEDETPEVDAAYGAGGQAANDEREELTSAGGDIQAGAEGLASGDTVIHGQVTDLSGHPVAGARVFLYTGADVMGGRTGGDFTERFEILRERLIGRSRLEPPGVLASTETSEQGFYSIATGGLPYGVYQVIARQEGYGPESETWAWRVESTEINFLLNLGVVLAGRVVDPDDRPVAGATVTAQEDSTGFGGRRGGFFGGSGGLVDQVATDASGTFRLMVHPGSFRVAAAADGYSEVELRRVPAGSEDVELVLAKGRSLAGRVVDEAGGALADVEVTLYVGDDGRRGRFGRGGGRGGPPAAIEQAFRAPGARVSTDTAGEFLFESLPQGGFEISLERAGRIPTREGGELGGEGETTRVEVVMRPGAVLEGRVTDQSGEPVSGAVVVVAADRGDEEDRRRGFGRGGPGPRDRGGPGPDGGENTAEDEARRRAERAEEPLSLFRARLIMETDADGRYRFDTLEKGTFAVSAEADDRLPRREEGIELDDVPVEVNLVLDSGLIVEGRVLSATDKSPVAGARLVVGERERRHIAETDEEGRFEIGGLKPGPLGDLVVSAKGYSLNIVEGVVLDAGKERQRIEAFLDPAARVSGTVVTRAGEPIARARVQIYPIVEDVGDPADPNDPEARRDRFRQFRDRMMLSASTRTDPAGRFELLDVPPGGAMEIQVDHGAFKDLRTDPFALASGQQLEELRLEMATGGQLIVTVVSPEGQPNPGARVLVRSEADQADGQAEERMGPGGRGGRGRGGFGRGGGRGFMRVSDATGRATFAGIDGGGYSLSVEAEGAQPFAASVVVVEEQPTPFSIQLLPENVITGVVRDLLDQPVGEATLRARVTLEDGGRQESFARSAGDGTFRIGQLGQGPYEIRVDRRGYASQTLSDVRVNTQVTIRLEPLGAISGWVLSKETGLPVPTFQIRVLPAERSAQGEAAGGADAESRFGRGGGGPGGQGGPGGPFGRGGRDGGFGGRPRRFQDPEGRFTIDDLEKGDYVLAVTADGYTGAQARVAVRAGETTEGVEIGLLEGLAVVGAVLDPTGSAPVAGAEVFLLQMATARTENREPTDPRERAEDLRRRFEELREERRAGSARREESTQSRDESLQAAATLLAAVATRSTGSIQTDASGQFELRDVPEGRYTLLIQHPSFVPHSEVLEISDRRVLQEMRIRLDAGERLRGKVTYGRRAAAGGVTLFLEDTRGFTKNAVTDANGRYEFTGLLPGSHSLRAVAGEGQFTQSVSLTIKKGKNDRDYQIPEELAP